MADLVRMVEGMRDNLKRIHLAQPEAVWDLPMISVSRRLGGVHVLSGIKGNDHAVNWLRENLTNEVENIVIGRMVVKHSTVLGADGNPIVLEKAIMVMGRHIDSKRAYLSITPILEHKDYRSDQFAEKQNKEFDPTMKGADKTSKIVNPFTGQQHYLQTKFGTEQIHDTNKGEKFLMDPIIENVYPSPRVDANEAQSLNAPNLEKIKETM